MLRTFISLAALTLVSSFFANLVVNGDFEATAAGSHTVSGQGLTGWTVVGPALNCDAYVAPSGYLGQATQMLDLSGYSDKSGQGVEQTLATGVGTYRLSFDLWTGGTGYAGPIDVHINGVQVADELINNPLAGVSNVSCDFNATGPSTIKFLSGDRAWVNHIDNVSVEAVPEPASLAALAIGAVAALRRRRAQ